MKIAIIQSNFLPWKGYFDIIHDVDAFVFLEDVQYTKNDWRNRNRIKTSSGIQWLTVPVLGSIHQTIAETRIDYTNRWEAKHQRAIQLNYAKAPYYNSYRDEILSVYGKSPETISVLNISAIRVISRLLDIDTAFFNSMEIPAIGKRNEKIIEICHHLGATEYISGPRGKNYLDEEKFRKEGIALTYKSYEGYPEYPQLWGEFSHHVSIIDLIFNCGGESPQYIWGWRDARSD